MKKCDEEKEIKKACKFQGESQRQRQTVSKTEKREIEKQRESKTTQKVRDIKELIPRQ